jgi:internalin A
MQTSSSDSSTPAPRKQPRRSLRSRLVPRITLRLFFILLTLFCIFLGGIALWRERAHRQYTACEQLEKIDWHVTLKYSPNDEDDWPDWLRALPVWATQGYAFHLWSPVKRIYADNNTILEGCRIAAELPGVAELQFDREAELNLEACTTLAAVRNLKSLDLAGVIINDAGVAQLAKLTSLESLDLSNTNVGNDGVSQLANLVRLKSLSLDETEIGDEALDAISKLTRLETLDLSQTKITSKGFAKLASLQHLKSLVIDRTEVDDQIASTIAQFPKLEVFSANDCALTDAACSKMLCQPSLTRVALAYTNIGPMALQALARLPKINRLTLDGVVLKPGELQSLLALKELEYLRVPKDMTISDLLPFHNHPTLKKIESDDWEFSVEQLKLLAGAPSTEKELSIRHLALGEANWRRLARATDLHSLDVYASDLNDQTLSELAKLKNLALLSINHCQITDAGLKQIAKLTNLEELDIGGAPITDEGLQHFLPLSKLRALDLWDCDKITEAGLSTVSRLHNLHSIIAPSAAPIDPPVHASQLFPPTPQRANSIQRLTWGRIQFNQSNLDLFLNRPLEGQRSGLQLDPQWRLSDRQLQWISNASQITSLELTGPVILEDQFPVIGVMPNLSWVSFRAAPLGPNPLKWLASLPELNYLTLSELELNDDAARILSQSRSLHTVHLNKVNLGPQTLSHLGQLPGLTSLHLTECQFNPASLEQLIGLQQLESLEISHCQISPELLGKLLPNLPALDSLVLSHCSLAKESLDIIAKNGKKLTRLQLDENPLKLQDMHERMLDFPNLNVFSFAPELGAANWGLLDNRLEWIRWDLLRRRRQETPRPKPQPDFREIHRHGPIALQLGNRWIGDDLAIEMVRTNPKFRHLDLSSGAIGIRFLEELAKTNHVSDLNLTDTPIGDDAMVTLAKLTRVSRLNLSGCNISDRGVEILAKSGIRLEDIDLSRTKITTSALRSLAKLRFLETIDVSNTAVDNEGVLELRGLKHLRHMDVSKTKVTAKIIPQLGPHGKYWLHGLDSLEE